MSIVLILSMGGWIATAMVGFYGLNGKRVWHQRLLRFELHKRRERCTFYDVTLGDMDVNCLGSHNCLLDGATDGVLSASDSSYAAAYGTSTGWDFATGIGTVNVNNLMKNWSSVAATAAVARETSP